MGGTKAFTAIQTIVVGVVAAVFTASITYWVFVPRVNSEMRVMVGDLSASVTRFSDAIDRIEPIANEYVRSKGAVDLKIEMLEKGHEDMDGRLRALESGS